MKSRWIFACWALALAQPGWAAAPAEPLDLQTAQTWAAHASGSVQGATLDAQARTLQSQALAHLGGPSVALNGIAGRMSNLYSLDTSQLAGKLNPLVGAIDAALPGPALPQIPNTISTTRQATFSSVGVGAVWPVYVGGRIEAAQDLAAGRAREAEAERVDTEDQLATLVAQRYFTLQLAQQAVALRAAATLGIAEHQRDARLLEQSGLIAHAERLRAEVALDAARRDEARARSDLEIAQVALQRLLGAPVPVQPSTPLFMHSQSVGSLQSFIDLGLAHHPAWAKLASKREQAEAMLRLQGGEHTPTVAALANYTLNNGSGQVVQPNWQVGLLVSVPLWSQVDHARLRDAARLQQQRVSVSAEQAGRDIPTLIEAQWRAQENARQQYLSSGSAIELAREHLKLQRVAFAQSQASSVDVTDAELGLAKTQIERLQSACDYVMALARLLEACGQTQRLSDYAASADIRLPSLSSTSSTESH